MPTSIKLQEQYGDDVQLVFVECQNTQKDEYEAFAWKMKWMGNGAMWTAERPLSTTGTGLPETAVLGIDGNVLMQGNPGDMGKKLEEAVAAEIKKAKLAPAGTPKDLEKVWTSFNKGEIAAALAECDKLASDASKAAKSEFETRLTAKIKRAKWLIDNGYVADAEKVLTPVEKGVKAQPELAAKAAEQRARLAAPEMATEREADKAYTGFVAKIAKEKPFEDGNVKKAEAMSAKFKGTKTAERIDRFLVLSKLKLAK